MSVNKDFEAFAKEVFFIQESDKVLISKNDAEIKTTEDFKTLFPILSGLIEKARKTLVTINDQKYILFAWNDLDGNICGWLNKQEEESFKEILIEEHRILLSNIGGIQESFYDYDSFEENEYFTDNQNFLFIGSECTLGIEDWDDYYSECCEDEGCKEIDYSNFISFVNEANGALTLYDRNTKEVLLFSHDHSFDNVIFLENQPEYTFHKFKDVNSFVDYVEELAKQWVSNIK